MDRWFIIGREWSRDTHDRGVDGAYSPGEQYRRPLREASHGGEGDDWGVQRDAHVGRQVEHEEAGREFLHGHAPVSHFEVLKYGIII